MTDPPSALAKAAGAAWRRYASTVCLGGTPEQRRWSYDSASRAEEKLARAERVEKVKPSRAA